MEETYKTINIIVEAQKKARRNNDFLTLMTNGEALLEFIPQLIDYSITKESEYRKYEAGLANEMDGLKRNSGSYCETQAKATDYYSEWQKTKMTIDWIYEMVNLSKKLATSVDRELNSQ